ncbi:DegT/DnrJ/EryC1/StrS family aminotransferase [Bacillus sp. 3255]|uniref:DegT/DnrJ/EryC1/StrS family aminotransferase n=1 Tax=Bacillus sp. 3255 TaxID=2817904 RepID=UPI0028599476|nr:DegT/DnrJ/EryC1/StrS family aminotransferase [Bacillus sp. 3255]MDR6883469.1 dTDP-4-amino-4,6-dideoxygalactose transaminase [Bacillus sp. 3255]
MINVTKTYVPNREKYKAYIDQIFDSGWFTNNGSMVQQLQTRLQEYLGVRNLLLVSNGTLALQVAYKLLGLKGEVITTPFSFVATTSTLVWEGLQPKFVDIDQGTLCLDPNKIEEHITPNTSAIVATHVYGNPCEVDKIEEIAKKHNLKVVYDAAHSFGVRCNGRSVYSYGDISIASFHSTKVFHSIEGGALIIKDDALYEKAKKMINFGIEGPERISELGINAKMNEFQAAMGLCVLEDMNILLEQRRKKYEIYLELLGSIEGIALQLKDTSILYNYSYFPLVFQNEGMMLKVINELSEIGVVPRRYFYPSLETLPYIQNDHYTPISRDISRRILCIPLYNSLETEVQVKISEIVRQVCSTYKSNKAAAVI